MPSNDKAGLMHAFSRFRKPEEDEEDERKLLGRLSEASPSEAATSSAAIEEVSGSYSVASERRAPVEPGSGLVPRPLLQREPERQLSFRCPVSLANELQRKARFNQLEQRQIIQEGLKRVLAELSDPPEGWQG